MRKLFTVLATAIVLLAGSALMKAEAAPMRGLGDLSPITKGASPVRRLAVGAAPIAAPAAGIMGLATAITAGAVPIAGVTSRHGNRGVERPADAGRSTTVIAILPSVILSYPVLSFRNLVEPGGIEPPTS